MSIISTNPGQAVSSTVKTNTWLMVSSLSGGTQLNTNVCRAVILQNIPTNSGNMHVGGLSGESPHATKGAVLAPGNAIALNVDNFNRVRVYAVTSGERLATIGESF